MLSEARLRITAPDLLKARIRASIAQTQTETAEPPAAPHRSRWRVVAAGVVVAAMSSALTFAATHSNRAPEASELVASHVRSLQPGHLTDIVSTNEHNVKPWFNGRVDASPPVIDLTTQGFTLLGGRIDYVDGRTVPVVIYGRRQHVINLYVWPVADQTPAEPRVTTRNGFNLVSWRSHGMQHWVVSDLNQRELDELVQAIRVR
jgi:anti-sigma factor RsiW